MTTDRFFRIVEVTKPGQANMLTRFEKGVTYTGTHARAAQKAMTNLCGTKDVRGVCTLTISVMEVLRNGQPKMDSRGIIVYKYKVKRSVIDSNVELGDKDVHFKYTTKIVKSFGRV